MTGQEMQSALRAQFSTADLEWKPQSMGNRQDGSPWCQVVPYISARAVYQRLDEVFGVFGWSLEIRPETFGEVKGCVATIKAHVLAGESSTHSFVTREDGSEPSDIDSYKGAISGAVKRVAVQLGIGRYLYDLDGPIYALIHEGGSHSAKGKDGKWFKWDVPPDVLVKLTTEAPTIAVTADGEIEDDDEEAASHPSEDQRPRHAPPPAPRAAKSPPKATKEAPPVDEAPAEPQPPAGQLPSGCTKCGGPVWDNRYDKQNPKAPDWKCKDKACTDGKYVTGGWCGDAPASTATKGNDGPGHPDNSFDDFPEALDDESEDSLPW